MIAYRHNQTYSFVRDQESPTRTSHTITTTDTKAHLDEIEFPLQTIFGGFRAAIQQELNQTSTRKQEAEPKHVLGESTQQLEHSVTNVLERLLQILLHASHDPPIQESAEANPLIIGSCHVAHSLTHAR